MKNTLSGLLSSYVLLFPLAYLEETEEIQTQRSKLFVKFCLLDSSTITPRRLFAHTLRNSDPYAIAFLRILYPEVFFSQEAKLLLCYWKEGDFPHVQDLLFLTFKPLSNCEFVALWLEHFEDCFQVFFKDNRDLYKSFVSLRYQLLDLVWLREHTR